MGTDEDARVWFAPRRVGLGWTPVTWEGWVVSVVLVAAALAGMPWAESTWGSAGAVGVGLLVSAVFLVVCLWKGTGPGGAAKRQRFDGARVAQRNRAARASGRASPLTADEVRARLGSTDNRR